MSDETYKAVQETEQHRGSGLAKMWVYLKFIPSLILQKAPMYGWHLGVVSPPRKEARLLLSPYH